MPQLGDIALQFCQQCLDWEDAVINEGGDVEVPMSDEGFKKVLRFDLTDLNSVADGIREWHQQVELELASEIWFCEQMRVKWEQYLEGTLDKDQFVEKLLVICLNARRKIVAIVPKPA